MKLTQYGEVNDLLDQLLYEIRAVLGDQLVGLYLYGSLVWGDFDPEVSDMDLLAATREGVGGDAFLLLDQMQRRFVEQHPHWSDRIEIAYVSLEALRTFKMRRSLIAIVSPGEPFHLKQAGNDWLINWYLVRERGAILFGPDPKPMIEPISKEEFIQGVKQQALDWRDWIVHTKDSVHYQGYAVLTMCRALYACVSGKQVSKKKAAEWAIRRYPQKAEWITQALRWRKEYKTPPTEPGLTYPATVEFVEFMIQEILRERG